MSVVTGTSPAGAEERGATGLLDRLSAVPWWGHALAYTVGLLVLLPLFDLSTGVTSDEGAYAIQVELIEAGDWSYDYPFAGEDPDARFFPWVNADLSSDGAFAYTKHPAYVWTLRAGAALAGDRVGLRLPSLVGAVVTAVAAWLLAAEFRRRVAPLAFWIAALGPALVNAYLIWGHADAAALGGLAAVATVRLVRRGVTAWRAIALIVLLAAGVLVRAESLLWAGALAVVIGLDALRRRHPGGVVLAGGALASAAAAFLLERRWQTSIAGEPLGIGPESQRVSADFLTGRVEGLAHSLSDGGYVETLGHRLGLLALLLVLLGAVGLRVGGRAARLGSVSLVGAAVIYLARLLLVEADLVPGLLAAWPIVLVGLVLLRPGEIDRGLGVLLAAVAVFAAAIVLTQYADGGGFQWGGRFYAPALAPLAAMAALGLGRHLETRVPAGDRRPLGAALFALVLLPAVIGIVGSEQLRRAHRDQIDVARSEETPVIVSGQGAVPRLAWESALTVDWLHLPPDEDPETLAEVLERSGVDRATLYAVELEDGELGSYAVEEIVPGLQVVRRTSP